MALLSRHSSCPPFFRQTLAAACLLAMAPGVHAGTYLVHDATELEAAITAVNASGGANFIEFAADITLTSSLSAITGTVTVKGNHYTLSGDGQYQLLVVGADSGRRILVQVTELALSSARVLGSTGSDGAGGGVAAGAAVQVHSHADLVLNDVTITGGTAAGGNGAALLTVAPGTSGTYGQGGAAGGSGGVGGGNGGLAGGGGGAALGGGVYVAEGGGLAISGATTVAGNTVAAGLGANDGSNGAAAGSGVFLQGSGNLTLRVTGKQTMIIADDISDAAGSGLAGASPDDKWNLFIAGGGGIPVDTSNPAAGLTYASVALGGNNRFGGDFYVTKADLRVSQNGNLGSAGSMLALDDGGIYLASGMTLGNDVVVNSGGGRFGVDAGTATLANDISGAGVLAKVGAGNLALAGSTSATGTWRVDAGALVLDQDARLGTTALVLNGGRVLYGAAFDDLRALTVTNSGGGLDNNGHDIHITNAISGGGQLTFSGSGHFLVDEQMTNTGGTRIVAGTVTGLIGHGDLEVLTGARYELGNQDQVVAQLSGAGSIELGSHNLTALFYGSILTPSSSIFDGTISGDGALLVQGNAYATQELTGNNTYTGGTRVEGAVLKISSDAGVGSGDVTLAGGTLALMQTSSSLNLTIEGSGTLQTNSDITFSGGIADNGSPIALSKTGGGTLILDHANTYSGTTTVNGTGSQIALLNELGLGNSQLILSDGGGLKLLTNAGNLRAVELASGDGVINTNGFDATVMLSLSGGGNLVKNGAGSLVLTTDSSYTGGTTVNAGVLQVGTGAATGTLGSGGVSIASDATLLINRAGSISLGGDMTGQGSLVKTGSGVLDLRTTTNLFNGALSVTGGTVAFYDGGQLGRAPVLLDNGALELDTTLNPDAAFVPAGILNLALVMGSQGGTLLSGAGNAWTAAGDISGSGTLYKTGAGTVTVTGIVGQSGGTEVVDGTLQIGSGLKGSLSGDVTVHQDGTLVFGRDDLTLYTAVISGTGTVIKRGAGELVLTGEQQFAGVFHVETGNLRIGLGGTQGSLSGDVDLAATTRLIFDRSDDAVFNGGTSGAGLVQKSGPGELIVTGSLAHTGGTMINSGILTLGNGGTTGDISGNVITVVGTQLAFNRSDNVDVNASVSGAGSIVQRGSGVLTLSGSNTQSNGVLIENGTVAIDSDTRLGSGDLIMDGGLLRFDAAFNDLRDVRLRAGGGGLDTNGFDIAYSGLISGNGPFIKQGDGKLVFTGSLDATQIDIQRGEFQLGDLSAFGSLNGNVSVASGATFSLSITGDIIFNGSLTGAGTFRQLDGGELRMLGDHSAFTGLTVIEQGSLRLDGTLGGGLDLFDNTALRGNATLNGNVSAGSGTLIAPGNSIGTITIGGNLTLHAGSILEMEVSAAGASDRINVAGTAALAGTLRVVPLAGDYTVAGCCTYTLLTAASVSGTFSAVNNDLVFLTTSVNYLPGQVDVSFTRNNVAFNTVSLTQNQQQVSAALDAMAAASPASVLPQLIAPLSAEQARAAFDTLSGDTLLGTVNATSRVARRFNHLLSARSSRLGLASRGGSSETMEKSLAAVRAGNMPEAPDAFAESFSSGIDPRHYDGPTSKVEGVWVDSSVFRLTESADDTVGSASSSFDGKLLALGADGYWGNNLILGFGAGYVQGDMTYDKRQAEGSATGEFVGSYGRWETGSGWHYKAALTLGQQSTDQTRNGSVGGTAVKAASSVDVMSAGAEFEAGIALHVGNYGLRPYALMDLQYLQRSAITETGAAAANLNVAAATDVVGEFGVGAEISRPWLTDGARWAQIVAGVALLQPVGDTQREQTVSFSGASNTFIIKATPDDSAALQLTLGAECYLTKSLALWGGYEGRISSSTQEHNGVLSAQYRW
ncbi:MAG: autotransporter domain-containing protein [bacterium]|nr:autotransporter domain-containing protein [bacterium]